MSTSVSVDETTFSQAGKVLAVHLSYASRAAQRGRTPKFPSYFMKASSSLAVSGSTVERPAGTELLAFEGEIALIIGKPARRVSVEDAWGHVGQVTAANDLGVHDIKYADKGSNIRSKSGDGYTPMGPASLDAAVLDPAKLRVQTWVNGQLVQDADTSELLFSFAQIVADLSQQMTLLPGDVILTGTPAGSSVFFPGDVVEVEVTDLLTGNSTGKLKTTAVEGSAGFASFGNQPKVTEKDKEDAYGDRDSAGLDPVITGKSVLTDEVRAKLEAVATATISATLRKLGLNNVNIEVPGSTKGMQRVIGTARTLRYVPNREDLFKAHGGGYNTQKQSIDSLGDGEILVMEARGETGSATLGDILALRAHTLGAAGIITDGGVRDLAAVSGLEIPVFYNGAHPAVLGRKHVAWDKDLTVACGGVTVQPGDVIVADSDGIVVIPPHLVEQVANEAMATESSDEFIFAMVQRGHIIEGLFPMNAEWKAKYNAWQEAGSPDLATWDV
ncbi:fumarylacetoacetate hydrolase family protein [Glutamicibacter sp. MNS18]|uniref:fumarylacetoacetate hydrolase family protein n=1 Tax=Glutamicibacter sp. MNS18 TaxID=2989817 RepID=UPI0022368FFD|nr:fumarylacetoacetate hydrolase family protein [Glutamicibacter sp. MNS18]MCW4467221.1 fumarylacetoacetate hydrolase family protein [Glutamicibacter sp. MNS18]